jgi:hypothetical protein
MLDRYVTYQHGLEDNLPNLIKKFHQKIIINFYF